ncbi:hypothetical protein Taro_018362 [Colocasia esculenta]|uniref:Glucan endo-1,3-beta-D-glucosidase n=1 Tax=Colocasia esculenta TaxID=4460 RepID=A0A843UQS6_COLES|nr:hypothetical protein [Colocasia esculenta]
MLELPGLVCGRAMRWGHSMFLGLAWWHCLMVVVSGIGANWGTQTSHPLPPNTVVQLLRDNGFQKVKLFDAAEGAMDALRRSRLEVMVGIPNDMLATLASGVKSAEQWVSKNVSAYINDGVNIRFGFFPAPREYLRREKVDIVH